MSERRVQALLVVEADVVVDGVVEGIGAGECFAIEEFGLQEMEERLHVGVVVHLAGAVHALDDVVASQEGFEVVSGVFDAAVAVEDQARGGVAQCDGAAQGVAGESGIAQVGQTPADDPAGELVHDHGQVVPLVAYPQVSHIAHPDLVAARRHHRALAVGHAGEEGLGGGARAAVDASAAALQVGQAHEAGHTALADGDALVAQGMHDARSAVDAAAARVRSVDLVEEGVIADAPKAGQALAPGVEARTGHAEMPAHHCDGPGGPVRLDEGEDLTFLAETNRIAFFRRSCSI